MVRLKLNDFELCDAHGNVYEWLHDYYGEDYYKQPPEQDPPGRRARKMGGIKQMVELAARASNTYRQMRG